MLRRSLALLALASLAAPALAQEPVTGVANPESLFTDKDPAIHRNKQATLRIMRELLQCNHWADAGKWLTSRYIQHNPNVISGLDPVVKFFGTRPRTDPCGPLKTPVVAVLAQGDLVAVVIARTLKHPADPDKSYTTSWFDMWRFVDGKADEHWDPATLPPAPPTAAAAMPADAALAQAQDRAAIEQLMWNYVRAIDGFDPDAYAGVFTPDGAFGKTKGSEALRKMVADLKKSQDDRRAKGETIGAMHHMMANQTIAFSDRDHAKVHYYWQTVFAGKTMTPPPRMAAAGRGVDDVVRINGTWLISNRNVAPD